METSKRKHCDDDETEESPKRLNQQNGEKCCCKLILEQQQLEIERLRGLLKSNEEDSRKTNEESSRKKFDSFEEKLNRLTELVEKQPSAKSSNFSLDSLHNKVDKLVRLMSDTVEAQSKMSKALDSLTKTTKVKPPPASMSAALKRLQNLDEKEKKKGAETETAKPEDVSDLIERQKSDPGIVEMRWGQNMMLIGDDIWHSFSNVDDVAVVVKKMEKLVNFRINCRPNEVLSRLYDDKRDQLLFAVPPKIYRIAISIGSQDLMTDQSLLTLRQASLEEVKLKNRVLLQEKARQLKGMVKKLLSLNKHVILVIPPAGTLRVEVFRHWEEVVLEAMQDLAVPDFKFLNMPDLVRSTLPDFKSQEDHLTTWFTDLASATLSAYGTRRLFDALRRIVWARNKSMLDSRSFLNDSSQHPVCPRCTRQHSGPPGTCKSVDRACKLCGIVGHFVEVHQVTDPKFRKEIVVELGFDIYSTNLVAGCEPDPSQVQVDPSFPIVTQHIFPVVTTHPFP